MKEKERKKPSERDGEEKNLLEEEMKKLHKKLKRKMRKNEKE